ncbi:MAG: LLM class F420-dependent oxidoreductase [Solirubrobacterales bacterium]
MTTASDRPVRIGVQLPPQHTPYPQLRDAVTELEQLGVDVIFNWDHFFPLSGDPDGLHFESWTMLAAIAEQTSRVEFGPLVNCNSYRNPDLQADMARTIDHISAGSDGVGRFVFGTGSGWFERDYTEYGYEFGTAGSRLDALAVDLPRVRERWSVMNPAPTRDIPILIGGGGEKKTLRIVAEHADIWHSFSDAETLERKLAVLDGWCTEVGRDRDEIELSTGVSARGMGDLGPDSLQPLYDLGVRLFIPSLSSPDFDYTDVKRLIAWRDEVNG